MTEPEQLTLVTFSVFENLLKKEKDGDLILLTFVTNWGGPCNLFDETLNEAEDKLGDNVLFLYCDIDEEKELAAKYDCRSVPSFVLFEAGNIVAAGVGAVDFKTLKKWIEDRLEIHKYQKTLDTGKKLDQNTKNLKEKK